MLFVLLVLSFYIAILIFQVFDCDLSGRYPNMQTYFISNIFLETQQPFALWCFVLLSQLED